MCAARVHRPCHDSAPFVAVACVGVALACALVTAEVGAQAAAASASPAPQPPMLATMPRAGLGVDPSLAMKDWWHWSMLRDDDRNQRYEAAIVAAIGEFHRRAHGNQVHIAADSSTDPVPGPVVLELGAGGGLLAMVAARAGARRVYAVEGSPAIVPALRDNLARNGFGTGGSDSPVIRVIEGMSYNATVEERADIVVHEVFGAGLLCEDAHKSVPDARMRLAKPGAIMVPARATAFATFVYSDTVERLSRLPNDGFVSGFDMRGIQQLAYHTFTTRNLQTGWTTAVPRTAHIPLFKLDFRTMPPNSMADFLPTRTVVVTSTGVINAVVTYWEADMDGAGGNVVNTGPWGIGSGEERHPHWPFRLMYAGQPNGEPLRVKAGDHLTVSIHGENPCFVRSFITAINGVSLDGVTT